MNKAKQLEKLDEQISAINVKLSDPKLCMGTAMHYTRVSGYFRATDYFNTGKKQEAEERVPYQF